MEATQDDMEGLPSLVRYAITKAVLQCSLRCGEAHVRCPF